MLLKRLSERVKQLATKHPKYILIGMMIILLSGIVMILVKRHSIRNTSRIDKIGEVVRSMPKTDTVVPQQNFMDEAANVMQMNEHLDEVEQILKLEGEVKRVLSKEVLTREDSIFLNEVNKKLTKLNYED